MTKRYWLAIAVAIVGIVALVAFFGPMFVEERDEPAYEEVLS